MTALTVGWFAAVTIAVVSFLAGWQMGGSRARRAAAKIVGPAPAPPAPPAPPVPPVGHHPIPREWVPTRLRHPNFLPPPPRPAPPELPPRVAHTPLPPATVPPTPKRRSTPRPRPNTHEDHTRSRVSPVGARWKPDVEHTQALPAIPPKEGT